MYKRNIPENRYSGGSRKSFSVIHRRRIEGVVGMWKYSGRGAIDSIKFIGA